MTVPKARLLAISAALLTPQFALAQVTSRIEAGALITDANGQAAVPVNIWRVAPTSGFRGSHGSLSASGAAWLQNQNWQLVDGSIGGTLVAPTIYGVRAELIGNASRAFDDRSLGADQLDVQTRINVQFNSKSGAWLGGGVARPWRVMVVSSVDLLNGGAWIDIGSATLTTTVTSFSFTKVAEDASGGSIGLCPTVETLGLGSVASPDPALAASSSCQHRSNVTDATVAGRWTLDRFELVGEAGHRMGQGTDVMRDSRYWASATMTMWVAPRAAIVAGGGRQPSSPARGIPSRTFGTLGMVLSYLSPSRNGVPLSPATVMVRTFDASAAGDGMQKFTVRVGGVESVDVAGDFSDWGPLTMVRRGRDLWELTVPISSGLHQINIRTDGGKWVAPPGLPTTKDMFNGEVGIMIIKF
jgi:hypothetical protein